MTNGNQRRMCRSPQSVAELIEVSQTRRLKFLFFSMIMTSAR